MIAFETGSADWIDIDRESGFCKSPHNATEWKTEDEAKQFFAKDSRYSWLLEKGMIVFQVNK